MLVWAYKVTQSLTLLTRLHDEKFVHNLIRIIMAENHDNLPLGSSINNLPCVTINMKTTV